MKRFALALVLSWCSLAAHAVIKEPENVVWGNVVIGGKVVTAAESDIVVEARRSLGEPPLASYRMGQNPAAGNFYSLAIPLESVAPIMNANATRTGETVMILVHNGQFVRYLTLFTIAGRGQITRLDLGDVDNDNNGLVDNWERQYFGAAGQDPNADPDRDGVSNRNEMLAGTNPLFPDSRHPADTSPTNNVMTIHEVAKYALAWKTGQAWPVAPTNIPVDFVARAGYLWKNGEAYTLDTNHLAAGAPLWWTNIPPATTQSSVTPDDDAGVKLAKMDLTSSGPSVSASRLVRSISTSSQSPITVTLTASPAPSISVYVVEDVIPEGWTASAISDDGSFDSTSRRVRWGLFFDNLERKLTYELASTSGNSAVPLLTGIGSFDGWNIEAASADGSDSQRRLQMQPPQLLSDGRVSMTLTGDPGGRYDIEISSDLKEWTVLTRVTARPDGKIQFTADAASVAPPRFFRAQRLDNTQSTESR